MTPSPETHPSVSVDELAHALDNSTPYPIELDSDLCRYMAERMLEMVFVRKNPAHDVWQAEDPPAPGPEPLDPSVVLPDGA